MLESFKKLRKRQNFDTQAAESKTTFLLSANFGEFT